MTEKVETCIKRLGTDFSKQSDNIWYEYDAQFRLMSHLSNELDRPGFPGVVHAEIPAKNRQRYDIAVYEDETAQKIVREDFCSPDWATKIMQERPIAAVIEVTLGWIDNDRIYWSYKRRVEKAIGRLVDNAGNGQLEPRSTHYVVICCITKQYGSKRTLAGIQSVHKARRWVKEKLDQLTTDSPLTIRVYWTSDHPHDRPGWIDM